ncbi:homoserine dehydrogenase [Paucidesulfovibrio gracilis DSM 16080]|uniref:Homoserine dehydrogenase n=1 Tax=Paucidesulfovibrio gracilis DSM 16080 TaxID=1121449 RepID=A0A1T4WJA5_9BACT|nr:homoserine dehydrogenase [Paucidesulfovibrio gracilis]SKA76988.1 homoserine dehydrogenase [Paucidesulfovibrio gracilis DSM 16080]
METVYIGLAGFGTVGSGLAKILESNSDWIERRLGRQIAIRKVLVRDLNKVRAASPGSEASFTADPAELIDDPDVSIVVELMGGVEAPRRLITAALNAGKHVVTANKHLLAEHGTELFALAAEKGLGLFYEASVAGGIPTIATFREALAGDRISEVVGILNGTANYILSEMTVNGLEFNTALSQAQDLGYAEADPTLDIEGHDTAHKLVVLIRLAFGLDYPLTELPVRGITGVTPQDITYAREFGYRIKLIAEARQVNGRIEAGVFPALVRYTYLLARVGGNYNAIRLTGNAVGPVMLHGQGAGDLPTGSAVLSDIMALIRGPEHPDNTGFRNAPMARAQILPPDQAVCMHYLRATVEDRTGVMASIAQAMADNGVSIAQAVQKGDSENGSVSVVFITHDASAEAMRRVIADIDAMDFTVKSTVHYRIM